MKSTVVHAIKTNRFPEATRILSICWKRCRAGLPGIHFTDATYREQCMMRGWSINHEGCFSSTSTHDLCDASFHAKALSRWFAHGTSGNSTGSSKTGKNLNDGIPKWPAFPTPGDDSKT